jgi:cell division protein FtsB
MDSEQTPQEIEAAAPQGGQGRRSSISDLVGARGSKRQVAWMLAALVCIWIVIVFARQVGEATAAQARADALRKQNEALAAQVKELQDEIALVQSSPYIDQQAREYGLGNANERPFALSPSAPSLAPDAPGSAATRVGAQTEARSPLESWLFLLFGAEPS